MHRRRRCRGDIYPRELPGGRTRAVPQRMRPLPAAVHVPQARTQTLAPSCACMHLNAQPVLLPPPWGTHKPPRTLIMPRRPARHARRARPVTLPPRPHPRWPRPAQPRGRHATSCGRRHARGRGAGSRACGGDAHATCIAEHAHGAHAAPAHGPGGAWGLGSSGGRQRSRRGRGSWQSVPLRRAAARDMRAELWAGGEDMSRRGG